MAELKPIEDSKPSVMECSDGVFLVAPDGTIIERLDVDECVLCHDDGPWIDEATQLCELCFEHTFGPDAEFPE